MSIESIQAVAQAQASTAAAAVNGADRAQTDIAPSFGELVNHGLGQVNQQLLASQTDLQQLAVGDVQNLHQVMMRLEESRLSFQVMLQVRNRLLEAYQELMKMQV